MIASVLHKKDLAVALGVSKVALNQWERDGAPVCEVLDRPLEEAVETIKEWRRAHKRPRFQDEIEPDADGDLQQQLLAAQVREKNAAARGKEIANAERLGELIEREEVAQQLVAAMTIIASRIEQIPDEARKELPLECRESVAARIDELVYLALKECAANLRRAGSGAS